MEDSLKNKVTKNVMWSALERFSVQGIQFSLTIIITRFVSPSDYGLVAMLGIFLAIAQTFIDSGFSNALIQKQDRTEIDYSTVFYFNIVVGVVVYLLLNICSPYIAIFYNEPKLNLVAKVSGIGLIINSFSVVQRAKLCINSDFRKQAQIAIISVFFSGMIGIYMAYHGYGVWSIVFQSLLNSFLSVILLWINTRWIPLLKFSWQSYKTLFNFGSKLLLSALLQTLYTNLYTIVIGKKYSSASLGYYNCAHTFSYTISNTLTGLITRAVYPIQCQIQNDKEEAVSFFIKYIRMSCYITFPIMVLICVLSKSIIIFLLTDKWLPSVDLLRILSLAYMWDILLRINYNILNAIGRTDYTLKSEILKKISALSILLVTIPLGIKWMCWGIFVYSFVDAYIITKFTKKTIEVTMKDEFVAILPIIILSFIMGIFVYILCYYIDNVFLNLFLGVGVGIIFYLYISYKFKYNEIFYLINYFRNKEKNR